MRLLIVEDDTMMLELLRQQMNMEGYSVDAVADGNEAWDHITMCDYDCIVLDIMLPGTDGITLVKKARKEGIQAPIILLTAKDTVNDRIAGLDAGADDYLVKPFSPGELSARVRALLQRGSGEKNITLSVDGLSMDTVTHQVTRDGREIELTPKEYALLEYFLRNKNRVLTREQIIEHIWNFDFDSDSNIIDVYIRFLRRKIDAGFDKKLIQTVWGTGYTIKDGQ